MKSNKNKIEIKIENEVNYLIEELKCVLNKNKTKEVRLHYLKHCELYLNNIKKEFNKLK